MTDLKPLEKTLAEARAARYANPCAATREAYKQAWQALADATPATVKKGGYASRAGKRQRVERDAMREDAMLRAARRR